MNIVQLLSEHRSDVEEIVAVALKRGVVLNVQQAVKMWAAHSRKNSNVVWSVLPVSQSSLEVESEVMTAILSWKA